MLPNMYLTMSPLIMGGVLNMVFTKTKFYSSVKKPIDFNKKMWDGKYILGPNKTWIGIVSMTVLCALSQVLCGLICNLLDLNGFNDLYITNSNTVLFNLFFGALSGFVYVLCELPNSFVKRRLNIESGKTAKGIKGIFFGILDQIDSLLGVMLILYWFSDISIGKYFMYVGVGGVTHLVINVILYVFKIRRNI